MIALLRGVLSLLRTPASPSDEDRLEQLRIAWKVHLADIGEVEADRLIADGDLEVPTLSPNAPLPPGWQWSAQGRAMTPEEVLRLYGAMREFGEGLLGVMEAHGRTIGREP